MPTYKVKTLEKWHHFVTYTVQADSEDLAKEKAMNMEIEDYDFQEYAQWEGEDEVLRVESVEAQGDS